uniref:Homeobox domain-containing protein n=1 Tax=Macrostomum lignano TaxID=282301 RepID=A0A1I8IPX4_9PLAT
TFWQQRNTPLREPANPWWPQSGTRGAADGGRIPCSGGRASIKEGQRAISENGACCGRPGRRVQVRAMTMTDTWAPLGPAAAYPACRCAYCLQTQPARPTCGCPDCLRKWNCGSLGAAAAAMAASSSSASNAHLPTSATTPPAEDMEDAMGMKEASKLQQEIVKAWKQKKRPNCEMKTRTQDKYRQVYSSHQRFELEKEYHFQKYISTARKSELSKTLRLSERQIKIWFQNRRAKERRQRKNQQRGGPPRKSAVDARLGAVRAGERSAGAPAAAGQAGGSLAPPCRAQ